MGKGLTEREYNDTFPRMDNGRHPHMSPQDGAPPAPSRDAIVVYQPDATLRLDVRVGNDTVWLTQEQMCRLFGRTQPVIARHIGNIFREGELDREVVHAKSAYTTRHGAIPGKTQTKEVGLYNLDVVISVGYRVKSLQGTRFRQWATGVLKDFMLRGYAFSQRMALLEDRVDRRLSATEREIEQLKGKVDYFVQTSLPPVRGVFFDGQLFDAAAFAARHILSATHDILLIDPWVDIATLGLLAKKAPGVAVELVTSPRGNKMSARDIDNFNAQYGGLTVRESDRFHDRFLAIDGRTLYLVGASLKDLGRKCFAFATLSAGHIPALRAACGLPAQ